MSDTHGWMMVAVVITFIVSGSIDKVAAAIKDVAEEMRKARTGRTY